MLTKKQLFTRGMLDISPHMLSVIPFGIICGAIGVELGFHPYLVYAMSFIIFGGASQIVFLQLLSGGASSLVAVASVGIINSRHLLYGAVLSEYLPKQLSEEETINICKEIIEKTGASSVKDMGKVMGQLKQGYSDTIDFSKAGALIKELLNKWWNIRKNI